jgi:hypothetical protein
MDEQNVVWVGSEALGYKSFAEGSKMTLNDGTVIQNGKVGAGGTTSGNGSISVVQGFVTLAEEEKMGVAIQKVTTNSVIATGSSLEDGTTLGVGSVIADDQNALLVRGEVVFTEDKHITFGGSGTGHTLEADYSKMDVGLSNTFSFKAYQAGSSDLDNSFMSQVGANSGHVLILLVIKEMIAGGWIIEPNKGIVAV